MASGRLRSYTLSADAGFRFAAFLYLDGRAGLLRCARFFAFEAFG